MDSKCYCQNVCKKVVAAFSSSWTKEKALADAQEQLKLPQHKLITESLTRWAQDSA